MKREPKNERGGGGGKGRKLLQHPIPTCAIFRADFVSRSSFFAPKPHGNARYTQAIADSASVQTNAIFVTAAIDPYMYIVPTVTKRISQSRFKAVWHAGRRYSLHAKGGQKERFNIVLSPS